jgi:tripartite-type tricarboxylate transporter receptor subunit TctC
MRKSWQTIFKLSAGIIIACASWSISESFAQTYPARGIRMIVGFSTGGGTDTAARLLAQKLALPEYLGQPVVIENRVGASGAIASEMVARAPADGYTLLMIASADTIQPALTKLPYDVERDFTPVSLAGMNPFALSVHPSIPARNLQQFITLARARPGEFGYGSSGVGSPTHLMSELFNAMAKTKINHVPYKGSGQLSVALASGEIPMAFVSAAAAKPLLSAARIRALAISTAKRSSLLPSVPTIDESGLPGYDMAGSWFGVVGPAGLPKNIVTQLSTMIGKILNSPEMREAFNKQGIDPQPNTPEQFAAFIRNDLAQNTKLIRSLGIKSE